jgi:hypothetical protein
MPRSNTQIRRALPYLRSTLRRIVSMVDTSARFDSTHPSKKAPGGCVINDFRFEHPHADELSAALRAIGLEANVCDCGSGANRCNHSDTEGARRLSVILSSNFARKQFYFRMRLPLPAPERTGQCLSHDEVDRRVRPRISLWPTRRMVSDLALRVWLSNPDEIVQLIRAKTLEG